MAKAPSVTGASNAAGAIEGEIEAESLHFMHRP
jgi:hypothetical protein